MLFDKEIEIFIRENAAGKFSKELTELVNKKFNKNYSVTQIKNFKSFKKIKSGIDMKLKTNPRTSPIGAERLRKDNGYIEVKVAQPDVWKKKGAVVWESINGAIPPRHKIIHLNSNKLDCRIENLACVSQEEMGWLLQLGNTYNNAPVRQTKLNIAKLKIAIKEKRKNGKTI